MRRISNCFIKLITILHTHLNGTGVHSSSDVTFHDKLNPERALIVIQQLHQAKGVHMGEDLPFTRGGIASKAPIVLLTPSEE